VQNPQSFSALTNTLPFASPYYSRISIFVMKLKKKPVLTRDEAWCSSRYHPCWRLYLTDKDLWSPISAHSM